MGGERLNDIGSQMERKEETQENAKFNNGNRYLDISTSERLVPFINQDDSCRDMIDKVYTYKPSQEVRKTDLSNAKLNRSLKIG